MSFILSCESTVDVSYSYLRSREIPVLFYSCTVDGEELPDSMGQDPQALPHFYDLISKGKIPSTSQLNEFQYVEFFDGLLQKGDVLHIAFGSGMTGSVSNAFRAAETLREKYPDRKLAVVDSLCSSSGYGLLVDEAADLRDSGLSLAETENRILELRTRVHHQFYSTDLSFFRRSGRVSGAAAAVGTLLGICPIMRLNDAGRIVAYDKARGKKKALSVTLDEMEAHAPNGVNYSGKCWICHSDCLAQAEATRDALRERFPCISGDIRINDIGVVIASHCGPGTVAVFFFGDERAPQ